MVFVQLHQHRRGNHQEVSQGHGDGVGDHRKALTQTTQTLKTQTHTEMDFLYMLKTKAAIYLVQSVTAVLSQLDEQVAKSPHRCILLQEKEDG